MYFVVCYNKGICKHPDGILCYTFTTDKRTYLIDKTTLKRHTSILHNNIVYIFDLSKERRKENEKIYFSDDVSHFCAYIRCKHIRSNECIGSTGVCGKV